MITATIQTIMKVNKDDPATPLSSSKTDRISSFSTVKIPSKAFNKAEASNSISAGKPPALCACTATGLDILLARGAEHCILLGVGYRYHRSRNLLALWDCVCIFSTGRHTTHFRAFRLDDMVVHTLRFFKLWEPLIRITSAYNLDVIFRVQA